MSAVKVPKTILICDDESLLREVLVDEFQSLGWTVYDAPNGEQGQKFIDTHQPTAILTDVRMPNGNGVDMVRHIPEGKRGALIIYFMSGFTDRTEDDIKGLGGKGLIAKPFKLQLIVDLIEQEYARIQ